MIHIFENTDIISEVCADEFACLPPHPHFGDVVAVVEDGNIKAFMSRELLFHIGTVWVNPADRKSPKAATWLKRLTQYVILDMPKGASAVVIDQTGKQDKLLKFIGLHPYEGKTYRIDFAD